MGNIEEEIARTYKKRQKAHNTLLECDLEIDVLLKILMNKQPNNIANENNQS